MCDDTAEGTSRFSDGPSNDVKRNRASAPSHFPHDSSGGTGDTPHGSADSAAADVADPKAAREAIDEMEAGLTNRRKNKRHEYPEPGFKIARTGGMRKGATQYSKS